MKLHSKNYLYDPLIGNFLSWFLAGLILMPYVNGNVSSPWYPVVAMFVGSIWTIWLHAYRQAILVEIKNVEINHAKTNLIRGIVIGALSYISHMLIVSPGIEMLIPAAVCALYLASIFWLLFDFFLNSHRGKPWDYRSKEENAATTDKIFAEKKAFWIASKIVLFIFGILLYYRALVGF